jgi:hypothetical protein
MTKQIIFYLTSDLNQEEMMAILGEALVEQEKGNIPMISVRKYAFKDSKQLEVVEIILKQAEKNGFGIIIEPNRLPSQISVSPDYI